MSERSRYDLDYSTRGFVADAAASFAGVLLLVTSAFDVLQGIAAIANEDLYAAGTEYLYKLNVSGWGWVHLVLGVLGIAVAVAILRRVAWGQILGIIIAALAMLTNFAFLPLYPWWSLTIILANLLIIWALSVQLRNYK